MGRSLQKLRIFSLKKLVSFTGCSAGIHTWDSSSNLSGITLSVWQKGKVLEQSWKKTFSLFFCVQFRALFTKTWTYTRSNISASLFPAPAWGLLALILDFMKHFSPPKRRIPVTPCTESQRCHVYTHGFATLLSTHTVSAEVGEQGQTHSQFESHESPRLAQLRFQF